MHSRTVPSKTHHSFSALHLTVAITILPHPYTCHVMSSVLPLLPVRPKSCNLERPRPARDIITTRNNSIVASTVAGLEEESDVTLGGLRSRNAMRMSAVSSGLRHATTCPNAVRSLCPRLLFNPERPSAPQHRRSVHLSPGLSAKSLLHKFSTKFKKKPWYESPSFTRPDSKPHGLMSLMQVQQKEKRGNNRRSKVLSSILYKALTGLLNTAEVSEEVFDLQIELAKVSVTADFSICRAYWVISGNKETDAKIEMVLQKNVHRFRHLLISHHVLGNVPMIVFLKDQENAKRQEIEDLLATLDFGDNNDPTVEGDDISSKPDSISVAELSTPLATSMFGIDHTEYNKKIAEYKNRMNAKERENEAPALSQQQKEQLSEIKRQKLLKIKLKKQMWAERKNVNPQDYLLALDKDLYSENQEQYDAELEEDMEEEKDDESKLN